MAMMCVVHTKAHMDMSETLFTGAGLHRNAVEDGATVNHVSRSSSRM